MDASPDPLVRFQAWLAEAKALDRAVLPEPTAFALATVGGAGQPSVRIVLLKGADASGLVFYTNFHSRKGHEVLAHPRVALCFHWQPLERQVRVEGSAAPVSDAEADAYFASRARGSQIGAWASHQSEPLASEAELPDRVKAFEAQFAGAPVPRPPHWSGFRVTPQRWELWSGRPSRLHQRDVAEREGTSWRWSVLNP